ncbi:gamma-glutamylcyclotransferase [Psychromarinibacter sp. C21-152]|uniref:glutathione-specific gamma-glutamylcyclotransferase n=1 Tax=Psychromarinibacter sediminicola TaxID=3033385 RepID=A0AAE3NV33_9RHOB|nr:gamma-glutamylcyclotransferase [Psychromarinibacter sediminicola]MDF0601515.1 gamma-glutamylcyclotransferase [Psychromarinibacter sediminicola]
MTDDPFRHHPGLRGLIEDPDTSFFRNFTTEEMDARVAEHGVGPGWRHSDAEREAFRQTALAGRRGRDLWVFAYGSLMWNPAIRFEEARRAILPGQSRRFILLDTLGGRGTADRPGVMAALDRDPHGPGCHGLAFRIAADRLETETEILWRRERIAPAYHESFLTAETDQGPIEVLAFTADRGADMIVPDLPFDKQVEYAATGTGFLGSSLDYLENLAAHFAELKIDDPDLARLLHAARTYARR